MTTATPKETTMNYAISHLREHAEAVARTIAAYQSGDGDDDRKAVIYWRINLAQVEAAIVTLEQAELAEEGR